MCGYGASTQTTRGGCSASGRVANQLIQERGGVPVLGYSKVNIARKAARGVSLVGAAATPASIPWWATFRLFVLFSGVAACRGGGGSSVRSLLVSALILLPGSLVCPWSHLRNGCTCWSRCSVEALFDCILQALVVDRKGEQSIGCMS